MQTTTRAQLRFAAPDDTPAPHPPRLTVRRHQPAEFHAALAAASAYHSMTFETDRDGETVITFHSGPKLVRS